MTLPERDYNPYPPEERGFELPQKVNARPFGAKQPEPTQEPDLLLNEADLTDKLDQIARLLRSLTCEQMWKLTEGLHKPGLEKELIAWARTYMGEEVTEPKLIRRA
jgi:hypothetical protein